MGICVKMTADLPANPVVKLVVEKEFDGEVKIAFRRPAWSKRGFSVTGKGKDLKTECRAHSSFLARRIILNLTL